MADPTAAQRDGNTATQQLSQTATWNYWRSLRTAIQEGTARDKQLAPGQTRDQGIAYFRQLAQNCRGIAQQIIAIPVLNVDEEVTAYASQVVEVLNETASFQEDFAALLDETKAFADNADSLDKGVEAFLRGAMGDPLGTYNDTKAQGSQLEQRRQALLNRWHDVQTRTQSVFDAQHLAIRATLARKYNREFPRLDN